MRPVVLLAPALLACCGMPAEIDPVARVSTHPRFKYEIELHARISSSGSPCAPRCFPERIDDRHWIYVDRLEGRIPAVDLVLTYERGKFDFPQSALKGWISI